MFSLPQRLFEVTMNASQIIFTGPAKLFFTGAPLYPIHPG
jgi:hypothetical protein